jgi:hypothetical protein
MRVSRAAKWIWANGMDGKIKGLQHGRSFLKLADQALEKAREQETAETHLKILEGR